MTNDLTFLRYTLCFLTRGDQILMLHRQKPPNQGLWNGVGGRLEPGESPRVSMMREVREETGFQLNDLAFAGVLTWEGFEIPPGGLYIFTAEAPTGEPDECTEGLLEWKPRGWVFTSPEVVSNIHVVGPLVFSGAPPQVYHFEYQDGRIASFVTRPLSATLDVG
jgi:8-oxo-dGTP diphosphatase